MKRWTSGVLLVGLAAALACSGSRARPAGPAPEYEDPVVAPWDAGAPVDPLDNVEGEWVDEADEPGAGDADVDADRP